MSKPIIAVVGGTGAQGGGVVDALLTRGRFSVRVLTRDVDGLGDGVGVDVLAEHRLGALVLGLDGDAGEADERGSKRGVNRRQPPAR